MFIRGVNIDLEVLPTSCIPLEFSLNGMNADTLDFGEGVDADYDSNIKGCTNRKFMCKAATKDVLFKYALSTADYKMVCGILKQVLSFGRCSNCAKEGSNVKYSSNNN